jgi:hypothetical protein
VLRGSSPPARKPSRSGMQTSTSTSATSFFRSCSSASLAEPP